jgi:hypothetical protein
MRKNSGNVAYMKRIISDYHLACRDRPPIRARHCLSGPPSFRRLREKLQHVAVVAHADQLLCGCTGGSVKAAEWFLLVLFIMLASSMRPCGRDYEARLSLIPLSESLGSPLWTWDATAPAVEAGAFAYPTKACRSASTNGEQVF